MGFALITGATSGIGFELALQFACNGYNLILVGRQEDKLKSVSRQLESKYRIKAYAIAADLSEPEAANQIFHKVQKKSLNVEYLVNNAGFYVKGAFHETSWENEQKLIQLQCITHLHFTKLFLPEMIRNRKGGILNVGSTGSFVPGPYNAVYCAAKSFVLSFSEALAEEVAGSGVTVTALCPGGTKTSFYDYTQRKKSFFSPLLKASSVAKEGYKGLMKGKRVVVPGFIYKVELFLLRFVPGNFITKLTKSMS